jgi:hypothetical protein
MLAISPRLSVAVDESNSHRTYFYQISYFFLLKVIYTPKQYILNKAQRRYIKQKKKFVYTF